MSAMPQAEPAVLIVGGGITGLAIGWYLARAGRRVTVLERGEAGRGATWAAAGTLVPWAESEQGAPWRLKLEFEGHALWPNFARELEAASDRNIDYGAEGLLVVALDGEDVKRLKHEYQLHTDLGLRLEWLSDSQVLSLEPSLSPAVAAGLFCPDCYRVDSRKAALALCEALRRTGGQLREQAEVHDILIEGNQVRGVRLAHESLPAETVILAAGAWSPKIGGLPPSARPPVHPVKGQMLAVQMPVDERLVTHTVWGPAADVIPRSDGRLLIGATVEEAGGFDTRPTAGAVYKLLRGAGEFLPGVYKLPIIEMWAGLRPGSPDEAPILGPTDVQGLILATGHFKRGILLAPLTAQAISHLVLTGEMLDSVRPFTLARFTEESTRPGREGAV